MKRLIYLLALLPTTLWAAVVLPPIQRNFFSTNINPRVTVVAGSNATVQASTVGTDQRIFTVNSVPGVASEALHSTNSDWATYATNAGSATGASYSTNFVGVLSPTNLPAGLSSSNYVGTFTGDGRALTNADGFYFADTNYVSTNLAKYLPLAGGTMTGAALTVSPSTNSPALNELATAGWVRGLLSGGQYLYNITNVHPVGWETNWNQPYYQAATSTNTVQQIRWYANVTNDMYLGSGIMSTQRFTTVYSPMTVTAYLTQTNTSPLVSCTLHPEFYYSYDGTNLLGDFECGSQTITTGTNLYSFVISYPTIVSTQAAGFYVVRRFKIDVASTGAGKVPGIGVLGSEPTASHISFLNPAVTDPSLGVRGATNIIVTACPAITNVSYNTATREFTVQGPDIARQASFAETDLILMGTNVYISPTNGNLQKYTITNSTWFTMLSLDDTKTETIRLNLYGSNVTSWATANLSNAVTLYSTSYPSVFLFDKESGTNLYWAYRLR